MSGHLVLKWWSEVWWTLISTRLLLLVTFLPFLRHSYQLLLDIILEKKMPVLPFRWRRKHWLLRVAVAGVNGTLCSLYAPHTYAFADAPLRFGNRPHTYISCALPTQQSHSKRCAASQTCCSRRQTHLLCAAWPLILPQRKVNMYVFTYIFFN